ncbi:MAG: hypothetical protein M1826_001578 [Phylliscum demangeonii]|nr:MAG: hypothetical protein M1826_001578 [Phylliscum demangeonii]
MVAERLDEHRVTKTIEENEQVERTTVVRKSYIIPCRTASYPALPSFVLEAKGPAGTGWRGQDPGVLEWHVGFREGAFAFAFRNLRVWAREHCTHAITAVNAHAPSCPAFHVSDDAELPLLPLSPSASPDNADTLDDIELVAEPAPAEEKGQAREMGCNDPKRSAVPVKEDLLEHYTSHASAEPTDRTASFK